MGIADKLVAEAKEYREKAAAETNPVQKDLLERVAGLMELLASKAILDETRDHLNKLAKESADAALAFAAAILVGEKARSFVEKLGGSTQEPERAAFEAGLLVAPVAQPWLIGQLFGSAGAATVIGLLGRIK